MKWEELRDIIERSDSVMAESIRGCVKLPKHMLLQAIDNCIHHKYLPVKDPEYTNEDFEQHF